jgi:hypothetical protein
MLEFFQRPQELACTEPSLDPHMRTVGDPLIGLEGCSAGELGPGGTLVLSCGTGSARANVRVSGRIESNSGEVQLTLVPPPGGRRDTDRMTFHLTQKLRRTGDCAPTP